MIVSPLVDHIMLQNIDDCKCVFSPSVGHYKQTVIGEKLDRTREVFVRKLDREFI